MSDWSADVCSADLHRDFQRLLIVQPRVDTGTVGAFEIDLAERARTAEALSNVLAGQLQMHATQMGAGRRVQVERMIDLGANVVEAPGLVAVAGALGVAMHRVRYPQHAAAFATHGFQQRWQRLGDVRRSEEHTSE